MSLKTNEVDVLIIGAGISGIGAAFHLQKNCPNQSYAIVEARSAVGGTWDLFRYPGIRSDSDMYTFGFNFKPWRSAKAISPGEDIRAYITEAASENGIDKHILFEHKVVAANWVSATARWHTTIHDLKTGEYCVYVSKFFYSCAGYYNYDNGYTPDFKGAENFKGTIIHPQHWPKDLDYSGKNVVVIGSGATAVTLVPTLAEKAEHVTMLQRSPTYIAARPGQDAFADFMRKYLPAKLAYSLSRWKNILINMFTYSLARRRPELVKKAIRKGILDVLGDDYPVDEHFKPSYQPWDQRVCLVPDGDLFQAIKTGSASVVTNHIDCFTSTGVKLQSGEELTADVIVTATGLEISVLGNYQLSIDDKPLQLSDSYCYKGMMLSGIPNFVFSMGYTNASWTLKSDLIAQYVCRLINHMEKHQYQYCEPKVPDSGIEDEPI
ncbi:NAD(P)/FAD-dependent oxidoreductase, partial [uncultured Paraglaciecola sp.]|uniref:flavin-containing monooxygenase n=1 Tax=uncultured Paraglaciecola sp. TaxID=1765024 RepID=UPI002616BBE7